MARLGGNFPFPLAQVTEGGSRVTIPRGGTWYPPSGQYLFITDAATNVQFWDAQQQSWQTLLGHNQGGAFTVDGTNYRIWNDTSTLTIGVLTPGGSGIPNGIGAAQNGVTASVAGGTQAAVTAGGGAAPAFYVITGGTVAPPTIATPGTGFLVPPMLIADPPPAGGIQATATCTLTAVGGGINAITIGNAGAGYLSSPNWWIVPQFNYYAGGPSGGVVAATFPPPGLVNPQNALPGMATQDTIVGAKLTPIALTGQGQITGLVMISNSAGWSGTAPTGAFALTSGTIGAAAFTVVVGAAGATGTVIVAPRISE